MTIVFPPAGQILPPEDRTFVLGHVTPADAPLLLDGRTVQVYRTGSFLTLAPVQAGTNEWLLRAGAREVRHEFIVAAEKPAWDGRGIQPLEPAEDLGVLTGEFVRVACRAPAGRRMTCDIAGMQQPLRASLNDPTVYQAALIFTAGVTRAEVRFIPDNRQRPVNAKGRLTAQADYPAYEVIAPEFECKARQSPGGDYEAILSPGTVQKGAGFAGDSIRLRLGGQMVFVGARMLKEAGADSLPAPGMIRSLEIEEDEHRFVLRLPGLTPHNSAWLETETGNRCRLRWYDVRAESNHLATADGRVRMDAETPWPGTVDIVPELPFAPVWGADVNFDEQGARVSFRKPPAGRSTNDITVWLDAGHGGTESGAVGPAGIPEKILTLAQVRVLKRRLESAGFSVRLTRAADVTVPIYERPRRANLANADLFISVHYNSCAPAENPYEKRGIETFYYNRAGKELARNVHPGLAATSGIRDHGVRRGSYAVCRNPALPAILLELDYLVVPEGEELIQDASHRERVAAAIVSGVVQWLAGPAQNNPPVNTP